MAQIEHLHQVAVIQRRGDVRLVDQHADEVGIGGQRRQDALQHHGLLKALGPALEGQEDLRHPAVGELPQHAVSRRVGHRRRGYTADRES